MSYDLTQPIGVVAAESEPEPEPQPEPEPMMDDGKVPCPDCGKRYLPGPGMGVHRNSAHGKRNAAHGKRNTKPCPECHVLISSKDLARHRRVHHGAVLRGRVPRDLQVPKAPEPQADDVDVDDIFATVISIIWPDGKLPVASVMALVQWREATQRMLTEVRNERSTREVR